MSEVTDHKSLDTLVDEKPVKDVPDADETSTRVSFKTEKDETIALLQNDVLELKQQIAEMGKKKKRSDEYRKLKSDQMKEYHRRKRELEARAREREHDQMIKAMAKKMKDEEEKEKEKDTIFDDPPAPSRKRPRAKTLGFGQLNSALSF